MYKRATHLPPSSQSLKLLNKLCNFSLLFCSEKMKHKISCRIWKRWSLSIHTQFRIVIKQRNILWLLLLASYTSILHVRTKYNQCKQRLNAHNGAHLEISFLFFLNIKWDYRFWIYHARASFEFIYFGNLVWFSESIDAAFNTPSEWRWASSVPFEVFRVRQFNLLVEKDTMNQFARSLIVQIRIWLDCRMCVCDVWI